MGSAGRGYVWAMRGLYVGICFAILFIHLLPLQTVPRTWAAPDFILALTMAWVARRPDIIPVWLVAAIFLIADFLLQRPPGLWAGAALVATEALRARSTDLKDVVFAVEWAVASVIMVAFYIGLMILWAVLVPFEISNASLILQLILTIAFYPAVVGLSSLMLGVSKAAPGQIDAMGRKL